MKRKKNTVGEFMLLYGDTLPKETKGELHAFCLKKGAGDRTTAATQMTEELSGFYQGETTYFDGWCLDKCMVDCNMEMFAKESLNMNSWDDLNESWNKIIFKIIPTGNLPKWDDIMEQNY